MKLLLGGIPCTHWTETVQLGDAFQVRDENWRIP